MIRQAEYYFKEKKFHEAAVLFSQSQLSFEEVTLKFIQVNRKDALKTFLLKKLETLNQKVCAYMYPALLASEIVIIIIGGQHTADHVDDLAD